MTHRRTRYYLDKRNGRIAGVCAGLADYTGIDALWVRVGVVVVTILGGFPWTILAYVLAVGLGKDRPRDLYDSDEDARFWQGVRSNPGRSARDVHARFRDIDRRLGEVERHYTSRDRRLADEIDGLR